MKRFFTAVLGVVFTIFGAAFAGVVAMFALSLVALVVAQAAGVELQSDVTMVASFVVGAAAVIIWAIAAAVKRSNAAARQEEASVKAEADAAVRSRQVKIAEIVSCSSSAADELSWMPVRLRNAAQQYAQAKQTYLDGAFSPFWSAVEAAYSELAGYIASADRIAGLAKRHAFLLEQLDSVTDEVATFSVTLNTDEVRSQHRELLDHLETLVYEAQKQPTFATIWEQRRTTAAVVQGFRNLEDAISSMGVRVSSTLTEMGASLAQSPSAVAAVVDARARDASIATAAQLDELRRARKTAEGIREDLRYPELGRWLT